MDKTVLEQYVELKEEIKDLHNRIDLVGGDRDGQDGAGAVCGAEGRNQRPT